MRQFNQPVRSATSLLMLPPSVAMSLFLQQTQTDFWASLARRGADAQTKNSKTDKVLFSFEAAPDLLRTLCSISVRSAVSWTFQHGALHSPIPQIRISEL